MAKERLNGWDATLESWEQSGRGLCALQDAGALFYASDTPPGFGVRAVLCRFLRQRWTM